MIGSIRFTNLSLSPSFFFLKKLYTFGVEITRLQIRITSKLIQDVTYFIWELLRFLRAWMWREKKEEGRIGGSCRRSRWPRDGRNWWRDYCPWLLHVSVLKILGSLRYLESEGWSRKFVPRKRCHAPAFVKWDRIPCFE